MVRGETLLITLIKGILCYILKKQWKNLLYTYYIVYSSLSLIVRNIHGERDSLIVFFVKCKQVFKVSKKK